MALEEMNISTAKEAQQTKQKILDKQEQLCELSKALAVLASASVRTASDSFLLFIYYIM